MVTISDLLLPAELAEINSLPARPITPGDLDALTERVRRRLIRWYKRRGFLDSEAAADLLS